MGIFDRFIESFKYLDKNGLKKLAALTERMFRFKVMPDAAARWEGKLIQYIGPTNATYHRGYFYTCVDNAGTYEWQRTDTQPNGDIVLWDGTHAQYEVEKDGIPEGAYLNFTDDYDSNVEVGVYSTRETKTGELFLGKPVYRRVFLVNSHPADVNNVDLGEIPDIDRPFKVFGWTGPYTGTGMNMKYRCVPFSWSNTSWHTNMNITCNNHAVLERSEPNSAGVGFYGVYEYTKVTD